MKPPPVLLIDSAPADLKEISRALTDARYTVHTASGFPEAADIISRYRGKLVVLSELKSGNECGHQFLKDTLKKYPFLPFIFIATNPPLNSVLGALRQGAYDFLRKPIPPEILLHTAARSVQKLSLTLETEKQDKEIRKLLDRSRHDLKSAQTLSSFKGFMISMAAHDFRSIITVLDGYLQHISENCSDCKGQEVAQMLQQAARTITRLRTMTNTLLDYEAAETGRIRLDVKPFPLRDALEECVAFYAPYAEQKKINLRLEEGPGEIVVKGDRGKMMEILDNLMNNALKFTPSKGSIRVNAERVEGHAEISVRDTGAGIPKEKLATIFDQAALVATIDAHARLGLGMTICKRLVEAQKGKIVIESVPGKGTKVSFTLPAV